MATRPDNKQLESWQRGIVLEDGYRTRPLKVWIDSLHGKGTWLRVILKEGRKRQIREMGRLTGLPVVRIIRVRIGTLELGGLKPKEWRNLTPSEVAALRGEKSTPSSRKSRRNSAKPKRPHSRKPPTKR